MAAACILMGYVLSFQVLLARAVLPLTGVALMVSALFLGWTRQKAPLVAGATAFLQMTLFTFLGVVLAYLLAANAAPLWDERLAAADARLGIDWPTIFAAADRVPHLVLLAAGVAYHSLALQMVACILVLAGTARLDRLRATIAAAILSGTITIAVSGFMPAMGNLFDPAQYQALWPSVAWLDRELLLGLRAGTERSVDLSHMTGIVSFPSYHAALPVILAWGVFPVRRLRVPAAAWAGLTIVATPLFGGHYVVDVLAGLLLAAAALRVAAHIASAENRTAGVCWREPYGTRPRRTPDLSRSDGRRGSGVVHDLV
jgi:hypothetical protein